MTYSDLLHEAKGRTSANPDMDASVKDFIDRVMPKRSDGSIDKEQVASLLAETLNQFICALKGKEAKNERLGDFCLNVLAEVNESLNSHGSSFGLTFLRNMLLQSEVAPLAASVLDKLNELKK